MLKETHGNRLKLFILDQQLDIGLRSISANWTGCLIGFDLPNWGELTIYRSRRRPKGAMEYHAEPTFTTSTTDAESLATSEAGKNVF
jgi:hypothetical protein